MRKRGLILENLDGTDKPGVMRGVPHVFAAVFHRQQSQKSIVVLQRYPLPSNGLVR
jgi:hypothetical protein